MALWNSRFKKPLAESVLKFSASIDIDGKMYNEDIDGSKAHVKMLMKQKIVSNGDGRAILKALEEIRDEIKSGKLKLDWKKEDIHTLIEDRLTEKIGERGKRLHTARSRNDQVALDERLFMRKEIDKLVKQLRTFQKVMLKIADEHKQTIIPGFTHLQRAQPLLFAHHILAYVSMIERDVERLIDCRKRANRSPLGAAALAGSTLKIDRDYTAKLLNMDTVIINSLDAVSDRDVVIEFISSCSIIMMHLSRLSEELVMWSSQEFGFALFDDAYATGSSLMPQKKNPDIPELVRGKTGRVFGSLLGILTIMKALPLAYNRDMQEDKYHLFTAIETTGECIQLSTELLKNTTFNKLKYEEILNGDLLLSTDLVDYLVGKKVPFREAHHIVGEIVSVCVERKLKLNELPLAEYREISKKFEKDIFELLTARASISNKKSLGSTSPKEISAQIKMWNKKLS